MEGEAVLRLQFDTAQALDREMHSNLEHGRAFCAEVCDVAPRTQVRLVLETPTCAHELAAEVVMVAETGPMRGTGLSLCEFDDDARRALRAFAENAFGSPAQPPCVGEGNARQAAVPRRQQLRNLPLPAQIKLAQTGDMSDRVTLERSSGKAVWEALLRNPRITVGEVARIARKGTVPRPLLELIVDNATWVKTGVVRRALLSNPKLGGEMLPRILKFTPKHELRKMANNPAYPAVVRNHVRRLQKP